MFTQKLRDLEELVAQLRKTPSMLHMKELGFFKNFILELGGKIPEKPMFSEKGGMGGDSCCSGGVCHGKPMNVENEECEKKEKEKKEEREEESDGISSDEADVDEFKAPELNSDTEYLKPNKTMLGARGVLSIGAEVSEEVENKICDLKGALEDLLEEGKWTEALEKSNEVIKLSPPSAMNYTKRADIFLRLNNPSGCVQDCIYALEVNNNNAKAHLLKGKAHVLMGEWEEAHASLSVGQSIDYNEAYTDLEKKAAEKSGKIKAARMEHMRKKEEVKNRNQDRRIRRQRRERDRRAAQMKKEVEEDDDLYGDYGGFDPSEDAGAGMDIGGLFSSLLGSDAKNPKVVAAIQDVVRNPANAMKYMNDPEVGPVLKKLVSLMGSAGLGGAGMGGGGMGMPAQGPAPPKAKPGEAGGLGGFGAAGGINFEKFAENQDLNSFTDFLAGMGGGQGGVREAEGLTDMFQKMRAGNEKSNENDPSNKTASPTKDLPNATPSFTIPGPQGRTFYPAGTTNKPFSGTGANPKQRAEFFAAQAKAQQQSQENQP